MAEPSESEIRDQAFVDIAASISPDGPTFTDQELLVLSLYDQLHELRLEHALLEAQQDNPTPDLSAEVSETDVKAAERQYLEVRATYMLQKSIVENVMISDPTLKAVHSTPTANPVEVALHPYLDSRDLLSMVDARLFDSLMSTMEATTTAEAQHIVGLRKTQELEGTMTDLDDKLAAINIAATELPAFTEQLRVARANTKIAKGRWRMMKSVVAAIVAGSGVDWASDPHLLKTVLDAEG